MNIEEVRNLIEIMNLMKHSAVNDNYFEITDKDVKVLYDYITKLQDEISTLQEFYCDYETRINKAIEYIRSEYTITDDDVYLALYSSDGTLDKLEKILKGEE